MKKLSLLFLAAAVAASAQVPSPFRALRPIMKDPNNRKGISSVSDKDLNDGDNPSSSQGAGYSGAPGPMGQGGKPAVIVARVDPGLAASAVDLLARVDGLKGTIYITNMTQGTIVPHAQLAVCNLNGAMLGSVAVVGNAIEPSGVSTLSIVATNMGAVDLKLMHLTGFGER